MIAAADTDDERLAWEAVWRRGPGRPRGVADRRGVAMPTPSEKEARARAARQLGAAIREIRESRDIPTERIARRLGVHVKTVHDWEAGRNVPPLGTLLRLSIALSTTLADLLADID